MGDETAPDWTRALVDRPAIFSRNGVAYMVARNWRADSKASDIGALKRAKTCDCSATLAAGVADLTRLARRLYGDAAGFTVTAPPCGHSRKPNCLGKRLAMGVAAELGAPFVQCWADRFVSGVSHPKEFAKLPPLEWITAAPKRALLIDDVATSGWHMEEALNALRAAGAEAFGIAWIGGINAGGDRRKPQAFGSGGGGAGSESASPFNRSGKRWVPGGG